MAADTAGNFVVVWVSVAQDGSSYGVFGQRYAFIGPQADLGVTKTDGQTTAVAGLPITYTIAVGNGGPDAANGATVTDTVPPAILGASWTCAGAGGWYLHGGRLGQHQRHREPAGGRQRHVHGELHHLGRGDRHAVDHTATKWRRRV